MLRCEECEYFSRDEESGRIMLRCDPFRTAKESECLAKWQLLKLDQMVQSYQATVAFNRKLAPLQDKMMRYMQRELEGLDEADSWKQSLDDDEDESNEDGGGENESPWR